MQILATNPWLQKERELFVHFFTDPAKLQMFSDLITTVDSHSLLQSKATVRITYHAMLKCIHNVLLSSYMGVGGKWLSSYHYHNYPAGCITHKRAL